MLKSVRKLFARYIINNVLASPLWFFRKGEILSLTVQIADAILTAHSFKSILHFKKQSLYSQASNEK